MNSLQRGSAGASGVRMATQDLPSTRPPVHRLRALVRPAPARVAPAFVEGSPAFHRRHGVVDVLAVVGPQRVIRVQTGRSPSEIAVLAVHVDELAPVGAPREPLDGAR
jgi:hypothetical protein